MNAISSRLSSLSLMRALPHPVLRASHIPERVELLQGPSSFSYKGEITKFREDSKSLRRVVDGVIAVTTASGRSRMEAQAALGEIKHSGYRYASMGAAGTASAVALGLIFPAMAPIAVGLALSSSTFGTWSFVRASDASNEEEKWVDPIEQVKAQRTAHTDDFNAIKRAKLKRVFFTDEEIRHIWHKTITHQRDELLDCLASGDFKKTERFLRQFIEQKSPFTPKAIDYAFQKMPVITNPAEESTSGFWTREAIDDLVDRFIKISGEYSLLNLEITDEMRKAQHKINKKQNQAHATIQLGQIALDLKAGNIPSHIEMERNRNLKQLEKAWDNRELDPSEYRRRKQKIEDDYHKAPEVMRVNAAKRSNAIAANRAKMAIQPILDEKAENKFENIKQHAREEIIKRFQKPIAAILDDYMKAKKTK